MAYIVLAAAAALLFLVASAALWRVVLAALLIIWAGMLLKKDRRRAGLNIALAAIEILSVLLGNYALMVLGAAGAMIHAMIAIVCGIVRMCRAKQKRARTWAAIVLSTIYLIIMLIVDCALLLTAVNPGPLMRLLGGKAMGEPLACDGKIAEPAVWADDYCVRADMVYESEYPNNLFDVYTAEADLGEKKPVYIYVHGGGYCLGDKDEGDPNAGGSDGIYAMFEGLMDKGFAVVSMNYALAPDCAYPTPVVQLAELIAHLTANADALGLDMANVSLSGYSAGGNIAGQFAAAQCDGEYAAEAGVPQVIAPDAIRSIYFGCALLDNERFGRTNSRIVDYGFEQMGRACFGAGFLAGNADAQESDVIDHVKENYPASFVVDGNFGTFNAQAHDMAAKLEALGIPYETMIFDGPDDPAIIHGFDALSGEYAQKVAGRAVEFIAERAGL